MWLGDVKHVCEILSIVSQDTTRNIAETQHFPNISLSEFSLKEAMGDPGT